eukprot:scaffold22681_cov80-Skeletonema_menzelii.AAC.1
MAHDTHKCRVGAGVHSVAQRTQGTDEILRFGGSKDELLLHLLIKVSTHGTVMPLLQAYLLNN